MPLGLFTVVTESGVRTSSSDKPLATSLAGSSWMRIAGFCWPPMETWADAGDLADLLRELGLDVVVDLGQRQRVGRGAEQQDRRVRRIDLAIGRRARQVLRQLPARGIDRGLHVVRGGIDVAVEIELDGDRRSSRARSSRSSAQRRGSARTAVSSGCATADAMVSGPAPGKLAETWMVGKSTCGSGATGSYG